MSADLLSDPNVQAILSRLKVIGGIPFLEIGEVPGWGPALVPLTAVVRLKPRHLELAFTELEGP